MCLILRAIRAHDAIAARDAARAHVERVSEIARTLLAEGHENASLRRAG
jgi:GntR family transcriptional regulator, trigonelline degradation regulator